MTDLSSRHIRPVQVRNATLDEAGRTVDVVWSTGAAVKRYSWAEGHYVEELSMEPDAVDLGRLNAGASFLDTHDQGGMASRLGAVVPGSARIEKGLGVCTLQISRNPEGERIMTDLRDGMALPISVGYRVDSYEKTEDSDGSLPTFRATRWEPLEISAVPVPADAGAHSRSSTSDRRAAAAMEHEMTDVLDRAAVDDKILELAERYNIPTRLARKAIKAGMSELEFRSETVLEHIRLENQKNVVFSVHPVEADRTRSLSDALADAVLCRIDRTHKPSDNSFVGLPVSELARRALEARGEGTRALAPGQLVERALHTTSDFPAALHAAANRQLGNAYQLAPSSLKAIAKASLARDFRPKAAVVLAGGGQLLKVNEHGEYRRTTFVEGSEQYALSSFGRIFGITRQALVNDDLGVFADLPARFGRAASEFEANYLAQVLEANARMADGKSVFHADHGNLAATGSALSLPALTAARLALRKQRDADGDLLALAPKYLIVPSALETLGEQLLAEITPASSDGVNPFAGRLELIVEPRLTSDTAWYLAADPALFTSLEYAHLDGQEGPRLDQRTGFDIDGQEFKVALDFGAAVLDYRGLYKNPGAA